MMFNFLIYLFIFVFGLICGSFLNCVIYRLALPSFSLKNLGGLKGRSYCPHCKHILNWRDLIPIFSFLILKGKCRYCSQKISWQYPLVELATGILFVLVIHYTFSNFLFSIFYFLISCFLIIIFVYDLKHYIIPDKVIYPAIGIAFFYRLFEICLSAEALAKAENLGFGILPSLFFLAIIIFSREKWLGFGDFKLAILMGLFLGWPKILVALFLAFFIGAIIGIELIILGKKTLKSEIPFGPFLVSGTFLAMFFGQKLIDTYLNLFLLK